MIYLFLKHTKRLPNFYQLFLKEAIWLPWWFSGKDSICQGGICWFNPWVGKICWRRKWQSTPVLLPGKSHGQRSLVGYSPWGRKESDTTEQIHFVYFYLYRFIHSFFLNVASFQKLESMTITYVQVVDFGQRSQ